MKQTQELIDQKWKRKVFQAEKKLYTKAQLYKTIGGIKPQGMSRELQVFWYG